MSFFFDAICTLSLPPHFPQFLCSVRNSYWPFRFPRGARRGLPDSCLHFQFTFFARTQPPTPTPPPPPMSQPLHGGPAPLLPVFFLHDRQSQGSELHEPPFLFPDFSSPAVNPLCPDPPLLPFSPLFLCWRLGSSSIKMDLLLFFTPYERVRRLFSRPGVIPSVSSLNRFFLPFHRPESLELSCFQVPPGSPPSFFPSFFPRCRSRGGAPSSFCICTLRR